MNEADQIVLLRMALEKTEECEAQRKTIKQLSEENRIHQSSWLEISKMLECSAINHPMNMVSMIRERLGAKVKVTKTLDDIT